MFRSHGIKPLAVRPVETFTLLGLGVSTVLLASVFWLPAAVLSPLLPHSWACERWSGGLWHGECRTLTADGMTMGALGWKIHGFDTASVWWQREDSHLRARVSPLGARRLTLDSVRGRLDLATLRELVGPRATSFAGGLRADGRIELDLEQLRLVSPEGRRSYELEAIAGRLALRRIQIFGFATVLPDIDLIWDSVRAAQPPWIARLESQPGPLQIAGTLEFPNGSGYRLVGRAFVRDGSSELGRLLARLGRPEAGGAVTLELSGTW
ncbi:MAG: type II secretion system protein N [Steroidobacteraceae bacterium]